ncbi:tyrosine-protein phosphatase non-receptor type 2 isoform X1 [Halyomorpha halys]|uniref:tyrosine-protein phosphatase non-receptor type 2 isoform X1 n=1 Tax=Halyomorpha halys TaxID=286706 RepID=UPI0006D4E5BF|nr:tyrosine-protein phosphatase non-receptor type 2 isoform X1 [Halyomorpha halys]
MGTDNPLSNVEIEFKEIDSKKGWAQFYQEIRADSSKNDFTTLAAVKNRNKNLNRYRDVSPYDHSRIVLSKGKCDYINANLIKLDMAQRRYILTQGPLQLTTGHFWLMVWEQNSKAIIMLNRIIEKHQEKCHQYWPLGSLNGGDDTLILTDVGLQVDFISEKEYSYYTTRVLRLKDIDSGEQREILQFHYTTWPDFGVPQSPTAFLRFLCAVRRSGALSSDVGPPVVHCSAGIGRSGTFCLVDTSLVLMKKNGNNSVNVRDLLMEMRKYRMGLIQTPDQLRFSYLAIIEGINRIDWDSPNDNEVIEDDENQNTQRISSSESDEEPPPLPPPRGESLNSSRPPDRPLPSEPVNHQVSYEPDASEGVRERKRNDTQKKTAEMVAEMKRKQEKYEKWRRVKRSLLQPLSLGLGALLIGGTAIALYIYTTRP